MTSRYEILTQVVFEHEYSGSKIFNGITLAASEDTRRCLLNLGLLYKAKPDGFVLLFDSGFSGRQRGRDELLKQEIFLQFACNLTDAHFYNYTALIQEDIASTFFWFYNDPSRKPDKDGKYFLHTGEMVAGNDLVPAVKMKQIFSVKPFALLDLELNTALQEKYYVRFPALALHWRYILAGERLQHLDKPAVIDASTKEAFKGPEQITLPDNRNVWCFTSSTPVMLSQSGSRRFQLVEQYDAESGRFKMVMAGLPLADPAIVSSSVKASGHNRSKLMSEIFIY